MKRWNIKSEFINKKSIVDVLLENRNIVNPEEKALFLNPPSLPNIFSQLPADFRQSLLIAKKLILKHIEVGAPIIIYGDYDADGVCSTAILYNTIKKELNFDCTYFIPNRFDHGYGLSKGAIDFILSGVESSKQILFITVDTGITAVKEADYIKSLGHKLIITDHHQKASEVPNADLLVWNDQVVASTISWMLSKTLGSKNPQSLGLAALATVTDLQPLISFNRTIVREGLKILNTNPPLGFKKLLEIAAKRDREITTYDLGFVVGPRLNASGRLEDATASLKLFIEDNEMLVESAARNLHEVNTQRQDKTLEMYEVAAKNQGEELPKIIISKSEEYHEGIIGLVAAKLMQKYNRPSIVISLAEEYGKGSVRSIDGIDIITILRQCEDLFKNLGGHKLAAGFTIHKDNIGELERRLVEISRTTITEEILEPVLNIDVKVPLEVVDIELAEQIEGLKPFGIGNPEPVFMSEKVGIYGADLVGRDAAHVSFKFYRDGQYFKGIYFNASDEIKYLKQGDVVDIAYNLKINDFNGNRKIELFLKEIRSFTP